MKAKKKPARYVRVDNGYGPASHYETVRVIDERELTPLFEGGSTKELLVESGGERYWVAFWEEL